MSRLRAGFLHRVQEYSQISTHITSIRDRLQDEPELVLRHVRRKDLDEMGMRIKLVNQGNLFGISVPIVSLLDLLVFESICVRM